MLEKIQSSLLVFCLDDGSPRVTPEDYSQVFNYLVLLFLPTDFSGGLLYKLNMRKILLHAGFFFFKPLY